MHSSFVILLIRISCHAFDIIGTSGSTWSASSTKTVKIVCSDVFSFLWLMWRTGASCTALQRGKLPASLFPSFSKLRLPTVLAHLHLSGLAGASYCSSCFPESTQCLWRGRLNTMWHNLHSLLDPLQNMKRFSSSKKKIFHPLMLCEINRYCCFLMQDFKFLFFFSGVDCGWQNSTNITMIIECLSI